MSILRGDQNACWHTFKEILSIGTSLPIAIISYALFLVWVNCWTSAYKGIECECSFWETESDCFEWSMHCNALTRPACVLCWDFWHLIKVLDIKSLMIMCWPNLCTECSSWHVMIGLDTEKTWRTKVKISKTKIEVLTNIISKLSGLSNSVFVSHLHLMQLMTSYERPQG